MQPQSHAMGNPKKPRFEEYGIQIEERGQTTHIFKDGQHVGSFIIDLKAQKLEFHFPGNEVFNYFAYIASDFTSKRVQWVNESLKNQSMDTIQAGVAFLGFAKFEELMAHELEHYTGESIH